MIRNNKFNSDANYNRDVKATWWQDHVPAKFTTSKNLS